jgi:predicted transcriptional regulator
MSRKIVWQIIEDFEREVTQEGARFVIVHLPTKKPLTRLRNGGHLKYQNLLGELKANYELIDPTQELIRKADTSSLEDLFSDQSSHYSKIANQVVGKVMRRPIWPNGPISI